MEITPGNDTPLCKCSKTKPFFQLVVFCSEHPTYCSVRCKNDNFKQHLHSDIDQLFYLEKNFFECPICNCNTYLPCELSCGHKLCNNCVKTLFDSSTRCPTCKIIIQLKSEEDIHLYEYYINSDHSYIINMMYNLIINNNTLIDKDLLSQIHFQKTCRDISNDINIIKEYLKFLIK
jgi:hypothetical protein